MSTLRGIALKVGSTLVFSAMVVLIKSVGDRVPPGEVTFFRNLFAIPPVVLFFAWTRSWADLRTSRPLGHLGRSLFGATAMVLSFAGLQMLPMAEATAIAFAAPILTVAMAAVFLRETVRAHRWTAVVVGFIGVLVMLSPHLGSFGSGASSTAALGALCSFASAWFAATAMIFVRSLSATERPGAIVLYFSLGATALSLLTLPFGWVVPSWPDALALAAAGAMGGVAQLMMTQAYRYADASVIAPLEYVSMVWAVLFGLVLFGELPTWTVWAGGAIIIASGLFIAWRERRLGLKRVDKKHQGIV